MAASYFTYLFSLYTLFSCIKKVVQFCRYVGLVGIVLLSNGSNCLVLIPHKHLRNLGSMGWIGAKEYNLLESRIPLNFTDNTRGASV